MATSSAKITVHNPITGELIDNVTFQMFYNMQFVDGRRIVYVNGTATLELDENNQVVGIDMVPFRPRIEGSVESGPIDPMTGVALNDTIAPGDAEYPEEPGPDAVYPPGAVPSEGV
jgi:hypothetical protein